MAISAIKPDATDFLIASKQCEIKNLTSFLKLGQLVVAISNLIHSLQRERGASNLFLGSSGQRFSDELAGISQASDDQLKGFYAGLAQAQEALGSDHGNSRLLSRIASALHGLSGIETLRGQVLRQEISADAATRIYIELIRVLLSVVFEAADTAADPGIAKVLVAMFNLMHGKELAGQERAAGSVGFAGRQFDRALQARMTHLLEAQERCFELFCEFADEQSLALYQRCLEKPYQEPIRYLRGVARSNSNQALIRDEHTCQWFELMSSRIDDLKVVEEALEAHLHHLCAIKFAEARQALSQHEVLIRDLQKHEPHDAFVVMLSKDELAGEYEIASLANEGLSPRLGRSVLELVQNQSARLQQMNDELAEARQALEERKLLGRAKALLMKQKQMSEDEAHRLLTRIAMNEGKRLGEVAKAVISMAEMWQ